MAQNQVIFLDSILANPGHTLFIPEQQPTLVLI